MHIFKQVVVAGSFSKAASLLRQPKSRVSRNIAALEQELGVQLIYRTTRQFRLTEAGRDLYNRAITPLNELSQILESLTTASDELSGTLRVTAPEDIGVTLLVDVCRAFSEVHPKIHIDLHLTGEVLDLLKESVDIAVRVGRLKDSSLRQKKFGKVRSAIFMSPSLRERYNPQNRIEELERMPYLAFSNIQRGRDKIEITSGKSRRTFKAQTIFTTNNYLALRMMAVQGMGFAILPVFLAQDCLRQGTLVQVFSDWRSEEVPIQVVIPEQREVLPRVQRFRDFLATQLTPYFV